MTSRIDIVDAVAAKRAADDDNASSKGRAARLEVCDLEVCDVQRPITLTLKCLVLKEKGLKIMV